MFFEKGKRLIKKLVGATTSPHYLTGLRRFDVLHKLKVRFLRLEPSFLFLSDDSCHTLQIHHTLFYKNNFIVKSSEAQINQN